MWDLKYRPVRFSDVLGQQGSVTLLKARVRNGTALDTSYIFAGGHGQGKTSLARILARAALCHNVDKVEGEPCNSCEQCLAILQEEPSAYEERDAASGGTIDIIRGMLENLPFAPPFRATKRVWLFDEAHRMPAASQDALLKALEDKKVVGILCTTEADKIRGAIRSRCGGQEYLVRKVTREDILARMKMILTAENVEFQDDAILIVIDHSGGHVRDVVNRLEQIAQMGPVTIEAVRDYLNIGVVTTYYNILLSLGDAEQALRLVEEACERVSPEEVSAGIAEAAMNSFRLENNMHADFVYVDKDLAKQVYQRFGPTTIKIAEYFLRSRYATRVSLECDIVNLVQTNGVVQHAPMATQPLVLSVPAPVYVAPAPQTSDPVPAAPAQSAPPPPAATPMAAAPTASPQLPPTVDNGSGKLRSDAIGPTGSGDLLALTSVDDKGVPRDFPRRSSAPVTTVNFSVDGHEAKPIMTPSDWRREFERLWPGRR